MDKSERNQIIRIVLSFLFLITAHFLPLPMPWKMCFYLLPYLLVGAEVIIEAIRGLLHFEMLEEAFLMTAATIGAFALGAFDEAVAVMLFYQVGELFQSLAVGKSKKDLSSLLDLRPDTATVLRNGASQTVAAEDVLPGEILQIRPGEKIPLDGVLLTGETSVNSMALTGESLPQDLHVGDTVPSGAVNLTGLITVKVTSAYADSTVARILDLVENAADKKSKAEQFVKKFAKIYTPSVVIAAILLAVLPSLFTGNWSEWIRRALTFLVVSCPCALVVSVPLALFCGIGGASGKGILVKGAEYLEKLAKLSTVLFDKTGTLTTGHFSVTSICPNGCTKEHLLEIAAFAEAYSSHPVAAAIVQAYGKEIDRASISEISEFSGRGVIATIRGKTYAVGNTKMMEHVQASCPEDTSCTTIVHVAEGKNYLGYLSVGDSVKANAASALERLQKLGVDETVMLTGDREITAHQIAGLLRISKVHAELMPTEKVSIAEAYLREGKTVAFVGDGINDAPVLMRADLGIAMGASGADAAMEAADIVLMRDDLDALPTAVRIARKTMHIVRQNILLSIAVKFAVLILGFLGLTGHYDMWIAVFADVGVTILAVLNALRAFHVET